LGITRRALTEFIGGDSGYVEVGYLRRESICFNRKEESALLILSKLMRLLADISCHCCAL